MGNAMSGHVKNILGQRFERLTVIMPTPERRNNCVIWLCRCDCGNLTHVRGAALVNGHTRSCGCLRAEAVTNAVFKHGDASHGTTTRLYHIWDAIKGRCFNPNRSSFRYYGEKGIKMCSEWKNDYRVFKKWSLANGYASNLTIDRIDEKGNYEPSNCQWLTASENSLKSWRVRRI